MGSLDNNNWDFPDHTRENNDLIPYFWCDENDIIINQSDSPIQTIHVGDPRRAMKIHKAALDAQIYVQAIRYPTVPLHKDLIRINLTSGHSKKQIQSLVEFLKNIR